MLRKERIAKSFSFRSFCVHFFRDGGYGGIFIAPLSLSSYWRGLQRLALFRAPSPVRDSSPSRHRRRPRTRTRVLLSPCDEVGVGQRALLAVPSANSQLNERSGSANG